MHTAKMFKPKVSIILLCHEQKPFLEAALQSILHQDYPNVEIIGVDDGSSDGSAALLQELGKKHQFHTICLPSSIGNCAAFNRGLAVAKGSYVVDLAADDVLMPQRLSVGVQCLEKRGPNFGVHYSDAWICDEGLRVKQSFFARDAHGKLLEAPPEGDVFIPLLQRHFVLSPTMMMRKAMLDEMGGYDESLSYEDFDFWVRSSRNWKYAFSDAILIKKRGVKGSLSTRQTRWRNTHIVTNLKVMRKALQLCKTPSERRAARKRLIYEARRAFQYGNFRVGMALLAEIFNTFKQSN